MKRASKTDAIPYREYHTVRYSKCLHFRLWSVLIHQSGKIALISLYSFTAVYPTLSENVTSSITPVSDM